MAAAVRRESRQRPVAAFQAKAERTLVRLAAENEILTRGRSGRLLRWNRPARRLTGTGPVKCGTQDFHHELLAACLVQRHPTQAAAGLLQVIAGYPGRHQNPDGGDLGGRVMSRYLRDRRERRDRARPNAALM